MTRKEAYDYGVDTLEAEGIENADCDVRILLEDLCGIEREELLLHGEKTISRVDTEKFMTAINRRLGHYPVQYITGKQEFMGLTFGVNQDVLIPRQDTEILVEEVLKELNDGSRILDMCTGSGCILLSLLYYSNDCEGVGCCILQSDCLMRRCSILDLLAGVCHRSVSYSCEYTAPCTIHLCIDEWNSPN